MMMMIMMMKTKNKESFMMIMMMVVVVMMMMKRKKKTTNKDCLLMVFDDETFVFITYPHANDDTSLCIVLFITIHSIYHAILRFNMDTTPHYSTCLHLVWMALFIWSLIARFMGPTWGPPGTDRTRMAPCWPHEPCYLGYWCKEISHICEEHKTGSYVRSDNFVLFDCRPS